MSNLPQLATEVERLLLLKTCVIGYKRLEKAEELDRIPDVHRFNRIFSFCQLPTMARVNRWAVGATKTDAQSGRLLDRCSRIHGLRTASEKSMTAEAHSLAESWMPSVEEARKQQDDYPRISAGEAVVLGPLSPAAFDPDVVMVYGNPAQIMMLMCGLQKVKYERFPFFFIGEGACADSLAQCYVTGKPSLAIPCYGERHFGQIDDDEIVIALPPGMLERAVKGMEKLAALGFRYPIRRGGAEADLTDVIVEHYPEMKETLAQLKSKW